MSRFVFRQPSDLASIWASLLLPLLLWPAQALALPILDEHEHSPVHIVPGLNTANGARSTTVLKRFSSQQLTPPSDYLRITVNSADQLQKAVMQANHQGGKTAIYLMPGEYLLPSTLNISENNIWLLSSSKDPYTTVLRGAGMQATDPVQNLIRVTGSHFTLDGLTLTESPNHLLQIASESNASYPIIRNTIFQDSYEQMLKVSYDLSHKPHNFSVGGRVEYCVFQYTRGIAPNYYTGGIDALGAKDWIVQNNIFRDIASPSRHIAQHAVHFWVNSENNKVSNNLFVDNDRAIGFGMLVRQHPSKNIMFSHRGGSIENNLIYHTDNGDPFADTGIVLEDAPQAAIRQNLIYLRHSYPRAIEYRYEGTRQVLIEGNQTNKLISSRNGGKSKRVNNTKDLEPKQFAESVRAFFRQQAVSTLYHPITPGRSGSNAKQN